MNAVVTVSGVNVGRIRSDGPNLQNVPIRTPEGERIRGIFMPEVGLFTDRGDRAVETIADDFIMCIFGGKK
jgi:hypothetical protein